MSEGNKKSIVVFYNLIWRFFERTGAQLVSFVVSLVLARLLDPSSYGLISLVTVFTAILQVFIDSGLGTALVQKKDSDDLDFSTVFFFNMAMCIVLYVLLFFFAPLISTFYEEPGLTPVIRVLGLSLILSGVKGIQHSFVSKNMMFKRFFWATLSGTISSAVIGIVMAYNGFGVWALVAQNLSNTVIGTLVLWLTVRWRPKLMFSFKRLKTLLSFGWKLLAASLINTVYTKIRQLIIGKYYSAEDLAFYSKGDQFPHLIVTNINSSIDSVLLPALSKEQERANVVKSMARRAIKTSSYIMWPLMLGLLVISEPLVRIILTEKWLPCVFYLRIMCIVYGFQPLQTANLNAIKAMGRSDVFLILDIIKKVVGLTVMFSTIFISMRIMVLSYLFTTVFSAFVNAFPNKKLIGYSFSEQIMDVLPSILLASLMAGVCYLITLLNIGDFLTIAVQIVIGILVYVLGSIIFKVDSFSYLLTTVKPLFKKVRKVK